jgi:hypothetical protein
MLSDNKKMDQPIIPKNLMDQPMILTNQINPIYHHRQTTNLPDTNALQPKNTKQPVDMLFFAVDVCISPAGPKPLSENI